jgi:hypothetical protein
MSLTNLANLSALNFSRGKPFIAGVALSGKLLLEGDMQSGTDYLLLEGDMQAGTDVLILEGTD